VEIVSIILILLVAAASRMLPVAIPAPLVQIALRAVIGVVAGVRVRFDPDLFFLLFLPPLLFLDGWRVPHIEALSRPRI
jgi:CPA1 family monovalent cation:H+ antiporter